MARTFKQQKHTRVSKKGKTFTAGQSIAIGAAAYAGTRFGLRLAGRVGGRAVEQAAVRATGRAMRSALGRRRQFITRTLHTRPMLKKMLGKATLSRLAKTEEAIIRFARKSLPK